MWSRKGAWRLRSRCQVVGGWSFSPWGRVRSLAGRPFSASRHKTAAARTIEPVRVLALEASRLRELCDAEPQLGYLLTRRILEVVSERLKATRMQLLDIYGP